MYAFIIQPLGGIAPHMAHGNSSAMTANDKTLELTEAGHKQYSPHHQCQINVEYIDMTENSEGVHVREQACMCMRLYGVQGPPSQ